MSNADWIKAGIDLLAAIISGVFVGLVVYLLDEKRAKRDRRLSDYRIVSNWSDSEPKIRLRCFDLTGANLSGYKLMKARMWATNLSEANLRTTNFQNSKMVGVKFVKAVALRADFTNSIMKSRKDPDYEYVPDYTDAVFILAKFTKAYLDGVLFIQSDFKLADFSGRQPTRPRAEQASGILMGTSAT